jgi:hypothetical protein
MARIKYQEAAGLEVKRGRPPAGPLPSKADLVKLYVKESRSIRDVARVLGCTKDMVQRKLKEYGIMSRPRARRSALLPYSLADLKAGINKKGLRGYSQELGVDPGTIHHHMKIRKGK